MKAVMMASLAALAVLSGCDDECVVQDPDRMTRSRPTIDVPVVVHVDDLDAARQAAIEDYVDEASSYFCGHDLELLPEVVEDPLAGGVVDVSTPFEMSALADAAAEHDVRGMHVWLVDDVVDNVPREGYMRRRAAKCASAIALERGASNEVLAHELGHMFGLDHVDSRGNIMESAVDEPADGFAASQGRRLWLAADRLEDECW